MISFTDKYLFTELLELVDLNLHAMGDPDGCPRFHFMPRFVRKLAGLLLKNIQLKLYFMQKCDKIMNITIQITNISYW